MNRRAHFLIHLAIIVAFVMASGAQWLLLQSVAWVNMIVVFSKDHTLVVALEKTFDGQNPCSLCCELQSIDKEEKSAKTPNHKEVPSSIVGVLTKRLSAEIPQESGHLLFPPLHEEGVLRSSEPIAPPPRSGALA